MGRLEFYPSNSESNEFFAEFYDDSYYKVYRRGIKMAEISHEHVVIQPSSFGHPYWLIDGNLKEHGGLTNETKDFIKYLVDALNEKHARES